YAGTKPGLGMPDLLPPRGRFAYLPAMEDQRLPATDKLHIGTSLVHQSRQVECGSSAANYDNVAASKRLDLVMARAIRKESRPQRCQVVGNVVEMSDANCQHYRAGLNRFTIFELQPEPIRQPIDTHYQLIFQLRHHSIPEGEPIGSKGFETNRHALVGILDAFFRTKLPQSERALWIVDVGTESVGL